MTFFRERILDGRLRAGTRLLADGELAPSAIFAVNDYVALDVMQAAKAIHLRIPEDLAVVGFDDMGFAAHVNPPLTTIMQPFIDIGLRAGTLLISRIEGIVGVPKHIEL